MLGNFMIKVYLIKLKQVIAVILQANGGIEKQVVIQMFIILVNFPEKNHLLISSKKINYSIIITIMNNPWEKLPKQNNFYVLDADAPFINQFNESLSQNTK